MAPTSSLGTLELRFEARLRRTRPWRATREKGAQNATALLTPPSAAGRCRAKGAAVARPVPSRAARAGRRRVQGPTRRAEPRERGRSGIDAPSGSHAASGGVCVRGPAMFSAGVRRLCPISFFLVGFRRRFWQQLAAGRCDRCSQTPQTRRRAPGTAPAPPPWPPPIQANGSIPAVNCRARSDLPKQSFSGPQSATRSPIDPARACFRAPCPRRWGSLKLRGASPAQTRRPWAPPFRSILTVFGGRLVSHPHFMSLNYVYECGHGVMEVW